jgi:hypothetical protein
MGRGRPPDGLLNHGQPYLRSHVFTMAGGIAVGCPAPAPRRPHTVRPAYLILTLASWVIATQVQPPPFRRSTKVAPSTPTGVAELSSQVSVAS